MRRCLIKNRAYCRLIDQIKLVFCGLGLFVLTQRCAYRRNFKLKSNNSQYNEY